MLLQPRKFTWKTFQKNRTYRSYKKSTLKYGTSGICLTKSLRLSSKRIFRLKIFLKRATKKPDFTRRSIWINLFPHLPLTKKPKGIRMGKGSGKLSSWYIHMHAGTHLLEFKNLRFGRAYYFYNQLQQKISVPTVFTTITTKNIKLSHGKNTNFNHIIFT